MQPTQLQFQDTAEKQNIFGAKAGVTAEQGFANLIGSLLSVVMAFSAVLLLLYLVWGAVEWITSAGESSKLQAARNKMLHAGIGMIILSSVLAIFLFVQYLLGITVLEFDLPQVGTTGPDTGTNTGPQYTPVCYSHVTSCPTGTEISASECGVGCGQVDSICCNVLTN